MEPTKPGWPEIAIEGLALGLFMISACAFTALLEHPASPLRGALPDATLRRVLIGVAMGLTAIALIYSPMGRRSGAHMNPAVTLTFWRLGRVRGGVAIPYVLAQFVGGALGVLLMGTLLPGVLAHPAVGFVATVPGRWGAGGALAAEFAISLGMMLTVLTVSSAPTLAPWTGVCAGALVALWISIEAPLSGMSMNPARTLASAVVGMRWNALWVYFVGPPLGMLAAAEIHRFTVRTFGMSHVPCAKLAHGPDCQFCAERERRALNAGSNRAFAREPSAASRH